MDLILALISGMTLGLLHAFDIDHVVAVSTFTGRARNAWGAARMGAMWGLGHTTILLAVGSAVLFFSLSIPSHVQEWSEIFVGILLVGLGIWTLGGILKERRIHIHRHAHDGSEHVHFHSHAEDPVHTHDHSHSLFALGMAHGFAGSGAVVVMIPVALADATWSGLAFLAVFGIGSTAAMAAFSLILSSTFRQAKSERVIASVRGAAGFASLAVGCLWIAGQVF